MKYVLLVYHDEKTLMGLSQAEHERAITECVGLIEDLDEKGRHVYSSGLQSPRTAVTLRESGGKLTVTDGPFAETKEFLGGFTIIEARDLNEAIAVASKFSPVRLGAVEIRPVLDPALDMPDPMDQKIAAALKGIDKAAQ